MACISGVKKSMISTCETQTVGGLEVKAWIGNRKEATATYDVTNTSKITDLALSTGSQLFTLTGVKKLLNAGSDLVTADDRANKFTHYFNFQGFEFKTEDIENFDSLDDVFVVVERKDKTDDGDGVFEIFGMKYGLYQSTNTMRANDINGAKNIELTSLADQEEPWSVYTLLDTDYATTLAALVALETPQA